MEIAVPRGINLDFCERLKHISNMCRISNIENLLSDCLEKLPNESPLDYVGELNKNDIMH